MSLSSCRVISACSRAFPWATTHIADRGVLIDTRLQVLEYGWVNAGHRSYVGTLQVECVAYEGRGECGCDSCE
jgi:hypothetical protein